MLQRLVLMILLVCAPVNADPVLHKFEYWGKITSLEKLAFYMGWTNGFLPGKGPQLADCLSGISSDQSIAMIDKRYKDHPEKWSNPVGWEMLQALTAKGGPCEGKNPLDANSK
jgi:hypothetical protein